MIASSKQSSCLPTDPQKELIVIRPTPIRSKLTQNNKICVHCTPNGSTLTVARIPILWCERK